STTAWLRIRCKPANARWHGPARRRCFRMIPWQRQKTQENAPCLAAGIMAESLLYLDPSSPLNLQAQIRQKLVDAILQGVFPPGTRLPSSRKLAEQLGVARNTVVLACEQLVEERFIESRERSGLFVSRSVLEGRVGYFGSSSAHAEMDS